MTTTNILRVLAWLLLLGLVVVTVAPIEFRPITPLPVQLERALALLLIGLVFALAYPRHILLVTALVIGATALLEVAQVLEPSRHGRLIDFAVKAIGGAAGILAGYLINRVRHRG